jgi:hypothetical protein
VLLSAPTLQIVADEHRQALDPEVPRPGRPSADLARLVAEPFVAVHRVARLNALVPFSMTVIDPVGVLARWSVRAPGANPRAPTIGDYIIRSNN